MLLKMTEGKYLFLGLVWKNWITLNKVHRRIINTAGFEYVFFFLKSIESSVTLINSTGSRHKSYNYKKPMGPDIVCSL